MNSQSLRTQNSINSTELSSSQKWMFSLFMTGLTVIGARISAPLPGTPVPITFQVFAVLLSGLLLGARWGALAQIQYLVLGCLGAPVFALGFSGFAVMLGVTGGYLWSYPIAAFVTGFLSEKISVSVSENKLFAGRLTASIAGLAIVYIFGTMWLTRATHQSLLSGALQGLLIFLCWDLVKAAVAVMIVTPVLHRNKSLK